VNTELNENYARNTVLTDRGLRKVNCEQHTEHSSYDVTLLFKRHTDHSSYDVTLLFKRHTEHSSYDVTLLFKQHTYHSSYDVTLLFERHIERSCYDVTLLFQHLLQGLTPTPDVGCNVSDKKETCLAVAICTATRRTGMTMLKRARNVLD